MLKKNQNKKTCECGYHGYFLGSKCNRCNVVKYNEKRKTKQTSVALKPKKRKKSGELDLFIEIWNSSPKISFISRKPLGNDFVIDFFFHVLPKGTYPNYRLEKKNIILTTLEEHHDWHSKSKSDLLIKNKNWQKVFDLYEELKKEYYLKFY